MSAPIQTIQALSVAVQVAMDATRFLMDLLKAQQSGQEGLSDQQVAEYKALTVAQLALSQTKIDNLGKTPSN